MNRPLVQGEPHFLSNGCALSPPQDPAMNEWKGRWMTGFDLLALKAGAGQKLKIFFQQCGSSAAVKHTLHYKSPFCFTNITLSVGQSINLTRRVITALHHQEWRRGKHEGKKRWFPCCISHESVGVWTHTLTAHTHTHTHTVRSDNTTHTEWVCWFWPKSSPVLREETRG